MKKYTLILVTALFSTLAIAGPWPQEKGKGYFKLSEWWIVFNRHYTDVGGIDPNVTTGIFNTNFYGEYGITPRVTGIVNAALLSRTYVNDIVSGTTGEVLIEGNDATTLGDIDLGVKYAITKPGSSIPVSATLILGVPTGNSFIENDADPRTGILQTGDGEFNQMLQLDAGKGFNIVKGVSNYVSGYVAFNNRSNGFSDELRWGGEIGAGLFNNRVWVIGRIASLSSFENGDANQEDIPTSIFSNDTEFFSSGFEIAAYVTKNIGVSFAYATATSGQLIAAAPTYSVGVFYDMSK